MNDSSLEARLGALEKINLALQTIVVYVFSELTKDDPRLLTAINTGFDNAALTAEVLAMKLGGSEKGQASSDILQIIEEFREIAFSRKS